MSKPKVGVLLLASGWMREVGLDRKGGGLADRVREASGRIIAELSEVFETVFPGVSASGEEAAAAARRIAESGCVAVVVAPLVWVEDQVMRAALGPIAGLPLILAILVPHDTLSVPAPFDAMLAGSGTVGVLQASGMLAREGRRFTTVTGAVGDPSVSREIEARVRAEVAAASLRCRIGLLGGRCDAMSVTWVDEVGLRSRHGVELVPLELSRLTRVMERVTPAEIAGVGREIEARGVAIRCDKASLEQGARAAAAVAAIAHEEQLAGLAMNDLSPEMHTVIGLRPCLPYPRLADEGFVVSMEADVAAVVLMRALQSFTGNTPFFTEIFTFDPGRNALLMGHAGWHSLAAADPRGQAMLLPDAEYRSVDRYPGAAIWFSAPPGPVTAVNAVWREGGLRLSWVEGHSVGGAQLEDNCHLLCRMDEPVTDFLSRVSDRGVSQHWVVVPGSHGRSLRHLARVLEVPLDG